MQPQKEDDNEMFVLRKQARANQKRIDKGMKPITPLHPDHKNLIKPMKKKPLTNKQFVANKQAAINKRRMKTDEAKMDPVGKADADIDNDGDVDSSDKYLHNRRKAIKKAISKENVAAVKQNKPLQRKLDKLYGKKPQRNKSLEKKLDKLYGPKK